MNEILETIVTNQKIAAWVIGFLLAFISLLICFVLWYVKSIIFKVNTFEKRISKNAYSMLQLKKESLDWLSKVYSADQSLWKELSKIRRTLVSGTLVLRRRKKEIKEILEDQKRTRSRLGKHEEILQSSIILHQKNKNRFMLLHTKLTDVAKEVSMKQDKKK